jgi:hypothetical protein
MNLKQFTLNTLKKLPKPILTSLFLFIAVGVITILSYAYVKNSVSNSGTEFWTFENYIKNINSIWDAKHYLNIQENSYPNINSGENNDNYIFAFFPMIPLLRLFWQTILGVNSYQAAFVNMIFGVALLVFSLNLFLEFLKNSGIFSPVSNLSSSTSNETKPEMSWQTRLKFGVFDLKWADFFSNENWKFLG